MSINAELIANTFARINPQITEHQLSLSFKSDEKWFGSVAKFQHNVFASGTNAQFPNAIPSKDKYLVEGELLLIYAGVKVAGYSSQLGRTVPINGKFSKK